jgi:hypothetical protein
VMSDCPERFERDMACTEAEWLRWLPQAVGEHPWDWIDPQAPDHDQVSPWTGSVRVALPGGLLHIAWHALPPRVIALLRLPRLQVYFRFAGVAQEERNRFMKRFDLYTQRGGG